MVKDFPLSTIHLQAQKASEAAECAGAQGAYWQMHDRLYDEQAQWSGNPGAVALFKQYARNLGLDGPAFDACLDEGVFSAEVLAGQTRGNDGRRPAAHPRFSSMAPTAVHPCLAPILTMPFSK